MNLADIRKKALQDKPPVGASPVGDAFVSPTPPVREEPVVAEESVEPGIAKEAMVVAEAAPPLREGASPEPPVAPKVVEPLPCIPSGPEEVPVHEIISYPGTMPPARPFDPLAELLAGRELAGSEDEDELSSLMGVSSPEHQTEEYLCFRVADESYAISIMEIKEIIKPREVTEVPRVPLFVPGIISLRGVIIPIYDLRRRLRLEDGVGGTRQRVLVVRHGDGYAGILVDQVTQVVKLGEADEEQPPAVLDGTGREFVKGIGHHDGKMLILLDLEKILDLNLS